MDVAAAGSLGIGADLEVQAAWRTQAGIAAGVAVGLTRVSLGKSGSEMYDPNAPPMTDTAVSRLAPAIRWDWYRAKWARAWVGGQLGIAVIEDRGVILPKAPDRVGTETRIAPYVAASAGVALVLGQWVSVGPEVKVLHLASGAPSGRGTSDVQGPTDRVFGGLALTLHVPVR